MKSSKLQKLNKYLIYNFVLYVIYYNEIQLYNSIIIIMIIINIVVGTEIFVVVFVLELLMGVASIDDVVIIYRPSVKTILLLKSLHYLFQLVPNNTQ